MTRPPTPNMPRILFALALAAVNAAARLGEKAVMWLPNVTDEPWCCDDPTPHDHITIGDNDVRE